VPQPENTGIRIRRVPKHLILPCTRLLPHCVTVRTHSLIWLHPTERPALLGILPHAPVPDRITRDACVWPSLPWQWQRQQ
jgi:hypothetical protein